jgi:hypothetical protein
MQYVKEIIFTLFNSVSQMIYKPTLTQFKNSIEMTTSSKYKGTHIFADYKGLIGNEYEIGNFVFELMQESIINASTMKIVHKNLVILNEDTQSNPTPPGFTAILALLQLDSSHMTATSFTSHSYTEEKELGLLCIDVFTCSSPNTLDIINYFEKSLIAKYPEVERVSIENHPRFKY